MRWFPLIAAIFLLFLALQPARTGMKIVIDRAALSFEMTAPFFRMAFDIGLERSKMNSARAIVR